MHNIARVVMLAGVGGAGLTYLGRLNAMPLMYWGGLAAIGGVLTVLTRRAAD
ncbi:MAG: hypothetical protein VCC01_03965 [Candidatus Hydrogenedentota bacterium]